MDFSQVHSEYGSWWAGWILRIPYSICNHAMCRYIFPWGTFNSSLWNIVSITCWFCTTILYNNTKILLSEQADICQMGMDQMEVNVIAREYCDKMERGNKPIILSQRCAPCITLLPCANMVSYPNEVNYFEMQIWFLLCSKGWRRRVIHYLPFIWRMRRYYLIPINLSLNHFTLLFVYQNNGMSNELRCFLGLL